MAEPRMRAWLAWRALSQLRAQGHIVPGIQWDADGQEGSGTCTRCGDGVILYYDPQPDGCDIEGTAYRSPCPGESRAHGWHLLRRVGVGIVMQCAHCGAERTEAEESAADASPS
ncbi:MAG TPA: hypothetical protein VNL35_11015 [Chloroflexota bacterium]|nr:hypothetical protein [Chloroflexota bacterium]